MDEKDLVRRLVRIEGKLNILARGMGYLLAFVAGYGVYFMERPDDNAKWYGIGAAVLFAAFIEFEMRALEKRLPYE